MTDVKITTDRILELIAAYGAEPGAWPEDERTAASMRIAESPDLFTAALAEARDLDALLQTERVPEPSGALTDAILGAAPEPRAASNSLLGGLSSLIFPQGVRWPAGAALASLMMGLVGGYAYASTGIGYDQADAAYYAAFGVDDEVDWVVTE